MKLKFSNNISPTDFFFIGMAQRGLKLALPSLDINDTTLSISM